MPRNVSFTTLVSLTLPPLYVSQFSLPSFSCACFANSLFRLYPLLARRKGSTQQATCRKVRLNAFPYQVQVLRKIKQNIKPKKKGSPALLLLPLFSFNSFSHLSFILRSIFVTLPILLPLSFSPTDNPLFPHSHLPFLVFSRFSSGRLISGTKEWIY